MDCSSVRRGARADPAADVARLRYRSPPFQLLAVVMPFDHEKLDVYTVALDFVVLANGVVEGLPRGRSHLADQLTRASISIVLNIAEGAGKYWSIASSRCSSRSRSAWTISAEPS